MPFKLGLIEQISQGTYPDNHLDLSSQGITDTEAVQLTDALQACPRIISLNLYCNLVGDRGVEVLAKAGLKELDLSRGNPVGIKGARFLANSSLEKLNLAGTMLGDDGLIALAESKTLRELDVSECGITDRGAQAIAVNRSLKVVNLGVNNITDVGAEILSSSQQIESLDLSQNVITSRGFVALLRNPKLQKLSLFNNSINFTEISYLPPNQTLRELSLSYISIEPLRVVSACFFTKEESCSTTFGDNKTCTPFLQSILDSIGDKHAALPARQDKVKRERVNADLSTVSGSFDWDSVNEKDLEELERGMELGRGTLPNESVSGKSPTAEAPVQESAKGELMQQMEREEAAPIINQGTPNAPETPGLPSSALITWAAEGGESSSLADLEERSHKRRRQ